MTDLLRDTLTDQANSTEPPGLDLERIISAGDRRRRRRRTVAVAGTAMITLAVIATGLAVVGVTDREPAPAALPFTERRATYAAGTEIHYGKDVISVAPNKISAFVQTDAGFVFVTEPGGVFVADGREVRRIRPDNTTSALAADNRGTLAGWVQDNSDGSSDSVVYDVAADRELVSTPTGNEESLGSRVQAPRIIAIDGNSAYFGTLRGVYRWDVTANKGEFLATALPNAVRTASSGLLVYQRPLQQPKPGLRLAAGPTPSDSGGREFVGQQAFLSPTAKYLLTSPDDLVSVEPSWAGLQLFEVATGRKLPLPWADHSRLIFSQWIDDNTFIAVGERRNSPSSEVDLLTCSTQSLTCQVTTPAFSTFTFTKTPPRTPPFVLPLGTPMYWLFK
ncbi:hypothetical protein GCM10009789_28120 [Kribbella sancticallisti]|uniref:Uncharacterized protein n=1 Tax=Kribbella sancticallisti TaxID=460087 RepID=A0ABN2DBU4_9ACTN